jgi:SWI/SNF-related matrix-associated actin-dependent regulator 1 of chromatin subfamily A
VDAEKAKAQVEAARVQSEQARAQIEKARAETETAKAALESALADALKSRKEAEAINARLDARVKELQVSGDSARAALDSRIAEHASAEKAWLAAQTELEKQLAARDRSLEAAAVSSRELQAAAAKREEQLQAANAAREQGLQAAAVARDREFQAALAEKDRDLHAVMAARDKDLQAAAAVQAEADRALQSVKAELQQALAAQSSVATSWESARRQLEEQVQKRTEELQASVRSKVDLQMALDGMRAELRLAADLHAADAKALDSLREEFEQGVRGSAAADQERSRLQSALRDLTLEHTHLSASHGVMERQLAEARDRIRQLSEDAETMRTRLDSTPEPVGRPAAEDDRRPVPPPQPSMPSQMRGVEEVGRMGTAMAPELESLVALVDRSAAELVRELDPSSPLRAKAQTIVEQSERATSLLRQLVSFSRRQVRPVVTTDLNEVVTRVEPTLTKLCGDEIELTLALGQTATLSIGEDDLEQILTALVFAARESLTLGGSILLSTSAHDPDLHPAGPSAASRVVISATAFGYGVQPAQSSSALDSVVRRCGGELTLNGEPDRDAILQITLPVGVDTRVS